MLRHVLFFLTMLYLACAAAPPAAEQQAQNLNAILRQADEAYYNKHESLMSDAAYDALREQYDRLITDYPELAKAPSVGAPPSSQDRIAHHSPVLSLQKAYSGEFVSGFLETCGHQHLYCVEPKLDGLTIVLRYHDGLLTRALTRGDGTAGTDVTAAVLASGAVPSALNNAPSRLEVRGEAFLPLPAFEKLNKRRKTCGKPPLKSPRNTAAGTLQMNDYVEIARRGLQIRIFELLASDTEPSTHTEALRQINALGLPVIESRTVPAADVPASIDLLNEQRPSFPFLTDGIVIRIDDRSVFKQLGRTAHHPRGALARKYRETPKETRLLNVEWTRGESGRLTPVAVFEPVEIDGATIQRASLHNQNYLRAMNLMIGDQIRVIRAGGSVPEVVSCNLSARTGSESEIPDPPKK
ncbi:NAD-dependent DNA ligase [Tichowtungia aerotolerans]|uniref:DNA ligase (NAD(+)) n=1 Tax=Tichowtungia aerotolerans TaxID=2697043 RepID=A0A6P1M7F3_9BACT|nr:hypothetical protein [Tichowtungia aerotolerans]QHI68973.1 hypothetical protein GT409_05750 [Tichowtungia aerotolerans]